MAGIIPSFASGSNLSIRLGGIVVAYATNLNFTDDVNHAPVGGIGSYSYDALEPTQYVARGSISINRYSTLAANAVTASLSEANKAGLLPSRAVAGPTDIGSSESDGNTLLYPSQFNPTSLLFGRTFDIVVMESVPTSPRIIFTLRECRMTGYSMSFTPGSLVGENVNFMCIRVIETDTQTAPGA